MDFYFQILDERGNAAAAWRRESRQRSRSRSGSHDRRRRSRRSRSKSRDRNGRRSYQEELPER